MLATMDMMGHTPRSVQQKDCYCPHMHLVPLTVRALHALVTNKATFSTGPMTYLCHAFQHPVAVHNTGHHLNIVE